jgi:hypothetical protein
VRQKPIGQLGGRTRAERGEPKLVLQFRRTTATILFGSEIVINGLWQNVRLLGDK